MNYRSTILTTCRDHLRLIHALTIVATSLIVFDAVEAATIRQNSTLERRTVSVPSGLMVDSSSPGLTIASGEWSGTYINVLGDNVYVRMSIRVNNDNFEGTVFASVSPRRHGEETETYSGRVDGNATEGVVTMRFYSPESAFPDIKLMGSLYIALPYAEQAITAQVDTTMASRTEAGVLILWLNG